MTKEKRNKIAYVAPGLTCSGGIRIIFEHCNRLKQLGHTVYIASECGSLQQNWFPDLEVPLVPIENLPALNLDVIVATGCTTPWSINSLNISAKKFYLIQGKDLCLIDDENWRNRADATYRMSDFELITISAHLQEWLATEYNRDAVLITNGLNEKMFYPEPAIPKNKNIRVLIEGSFTAPYKGVKEAFEAVSDLDDLEIWCVTTSQDVDPPGKADKLWRLPDQNTFRQIYSSSDIFIKLSTLAGLDLPPIEAMACGCAVIINNIPGVDVYAINEHNCLLLEPGNIEAARRAIVRLRDDKELRNNLIEGGFRTIKENFGWDERIIQLEKIYFSSGIRK